MTLQQFLLDNLWPLLMGLGGLAATVITIRVTMLSVMAEVSGLHIKTDGHATRITSLEQHQAFRLGHEQGLKDAKSSST